jgi:hypothetical protein
MKKNSPLYWLGRTRPAAPVEPAPVAVKNPWEVGRPPVQMVQEDIERIREYIYANVGIPRRFLDWGALVEYVPSDAPEHYPVLTRALESFVATAQSRWVGASVTREMAAAIQNEVRDAVLRYREDGGPQSGWPRGVTVSTDVSIDGNVNVRFSLIDTDTMYAPFVPMRPERSTNDDLVDALTFQIAESTAFVSPPLIPLLMPLLLEQRRQMAERPTPEEDETLGEVTQEMLRDETFRMLQATVANRSQNRRPNRLARNLLRQQCCECQGNLTCRFCLTRENTQED